MAGPKLPEWKDDTDRMFGGGRPLVQEDNGIGLPELDDWQDEPTASLDQLETPKIDVQFSEGFTMRAHAVESTELATQDQRPAVFDGAADMEIQAPVMRSHNLTVRPDAGTELAVVQSHDALQPSWLSRTVENFREKRAASEENRREIVARQQQRAAEEEARRREDAERIAAARKETDEQYSIHYQTDTERMIDSMRVASTIEAGHLRLPKPFELNRIVRSLTLENLARNTGSLLPPSVPGVGLEAYEKPLVESAMHRNYEAGRTARPFNEKKHAHETWHDTTLADARARTERSIHEAQANAMAQVYVGSLDPQKHREEAFTGIREAIGLNDNEWEIDEKTRRLKLISRYVADPSTLNEYGLPEYDTDPSLDGIGKVIDNCGKTLEHVDPSARDMRVTGLIVENNGSSFPIELRVSGFDKVESLTDDMTDEEREFQIKNPEIIYTAEVEPRHVNAPASTILMQQIVNRHSQLGGHFVTDPRVWVKLQAETHRRIVLPQFESKAQLTAEVQRETVANARQQLMGFAILNIHNDLVSPRDITPQVPSDFTIGELGTGEQ